MVKNNPVYPCLDNVSANGIYDQSFLSDNSFHLRSCAISAFYLILKDLIIS